MIPRMRGRARVALTAGLRPEQVPLDRIPELDTDYWFTAADPAPTVRQIVEHLRLIREVDLGFPIILDPDGGVMDGMHRVCKALLGGRTEIEAVRFLTDPEPDFVGVDPDDLPYDD